MNYKADPKILVLKSPPNTGGGKTYVVQLINGISDEMNVTVGCPHNDPLWKALEPLDVELIPVPLQGKFDIESVGKLRNTFKNQNVEIIHGADTVSFYLATLALFSLPRLSKKILKVWTCHTPLRDCRDAGKIRKIMNKKAEWFLSSFADRVITVSAYTKNYLLTLHSYEQKFSLIYNAVPRTYGNPRSNREIKDKRFLVGVESEKLIGYVGRLEKGKGIQYLLQAAKLVIEEMPFVGFLMVGDGPEMNRLKNLTEYLSIKENVLFTGYRDDVEELYPLFEVLVMPSLYEGFPFTAIEALTFGTPVIATPVGGLPEIVQDGETGLLVPVKSPKVLAEAIKKILTNPQLARKLGQQGKSLVQREFSHEQMIRKHLNVYQELLKSDKNI